MYKADVFRAKFQGISPQNMQNMAWYGPESPIKVASSPIAGWFISWTILSRWMISGATHSSIYWTIKKPYNHIPMMDDLGHVTDYRRLLILGNIHIFNQIVSSSQSHGLESQRIFSESIYYELALMCICTYIYMYISHTHIYIYIYIHTHTSYIPKDSEGFEK